MQRTERGFYSLIFFSFVRKYTHHQRVALDIDFAGALRGWTDVTIIPYSTAIRSVHLNCRQLTIHRVICNGVSCDYSYDDPLTRFGLTNPSDPKTHPEAKRKVYTALNEGAEGELSIALPPGVFSRTTGQNVADRFGSDAALEIATSNGNVGNGSSALALELTPVTIRIEYFLRNPVDGIQFVLPTERARSQLPHLFTSTITPESARSWVPCIDSLWERCTWEFEFVVPRQLRLTAEELGEGIAAEQASEVLVVCSGELTEQVIHPFNPNKSIYRFSQALPTSVQHIAFAAGPFQAHVLTNRSKKDGENFDACTSGRQLMAFCLPGRQGDLLESVGFLGQAMDFYSREFGSYPFGSFKVVFVDEPVAPVQTSATLSVLSSDLLHPASVIDQVYETRHVLSHALASQWIGMNIIPKAYSDVWLINGLSLYMTGLFMRKLFGNNEYRFRLKKDMNRLVAMDIGMPPVSQAGLTEPPGPSVLPFINLKAPLVLHILDRRLCKIGSSYGLSRVIPKVLLSAMSGELTNNWLSTHTFLRTCRKVSGSDLKPFADQWIYGSGCPRFMFSARFNRKKMTVEMEMNQECPAAQYAMANPDETMGFNAVQLFEGQMTVRIHEADGTPYEHVVDIKGGHKRFEVPFNTKYKRVRRNTKRFQARQAAAAAAAAGDAEAAEAMGMIDFGFGLGMWEQEEERERWRVADWTEEDEAQMSSATYEWIRIDADFEWITTIIFDQPDHMWISQLQRDRDVVAQLEAVHALAQMPSPIVSSHLAKTALVTNYFFRVRTEAVAALVSCATPICDYLGLFHLLKLFQSRFCYEPEQETVDVFDFKCIPKANDFSDIAEYFLQKAIVAAVSRVRDESGRTYPIVRRFLLDLLRYNDNSFNRFSDAYYVATVISALASSLIPHDTLRSQLTTSSHLEDPQDSQILGAALEEMERYEDLDRLVPSFHNVITIAALEAEVTLMLANVIPTDLKPFIAASREGNFTPVRIAALDCILLARGLRLKAVNRYLFSLLRNDPSLILRRHLARSMCDSLAVGLANGDFGAFPARDAMLLEDNGSSASSVDLSLKVEQLVKDVRRDVGRASSVREGFLSCLLADDTDPETRWVLLKMADILFKPAEESLPKVQVRVRLPPAPEQTTTSTPSIPPAPTSRPVTLKLAPGKLASRKSASSSEQRVTVKPPPAERAVTPAPAPAPSPPRPVTLKVLPSKQAKKNSAPPKPAPEEPPSKEQAAPSAPPVSPASPPRVKVSPGKQANKDSATSSEEPASKKKSRPAKPRKAVETKKTDWVQKAPFNAKRVKPVLKILQNHPESVLFLRPVDPVADGCPTYYDEIKQPMDFGTIQKKLDAGEYSTNDEFASDVQLVFDNCRQFNPPTTDPHNWANDVEKAWRKEWAKALVPKLTYSEKRALQGMLSRLKGEQGAFLFLEPVDPIALGIPTYFDVIPKENARDLKTIKQKLDADQYPTFDAFEADVRLMLNNCYTFNVHSPDIIALAEAFESAFNKAFPDVRSQFEGGPVKGKRPRKDTEQEVANKKAKV